MGTLLDLLVETSFKECFLCFLPCKNKQEMVLLWKGKKKSSFSPSLVATRNRGRGFSIRDDKVQIKKYIVKII